MIYFVSHVVRPGYTSTPSAPTVQRFEPTFLLRAAGCVTRLQGFLASFIHRSVSFIYYPSTQLFCMNRCKTSSGIELHTEFLLLNSIWYPQPFRCLVSTPLLATVLEASSRRQLGLHVIAVLLSQSQLENIRSHNLVQLYALKRCYVHTSFLV